ncbi:FixH family protein [Mucilaginibacter sp. NFX135]|uniref:FixH family protein n=1 Tax=Mucilaginibacter sp. NFX135 TaxID=3402687 RepID=UPI003AFB2B54
MNWGKGIMLGMALFMLFIIGMCIHMFRMPADEYDHHYYEKGLNFDQDYNKERQVVMDKAWPQIRMNGNSVRIDFKKSAEGNIRFIRPSSEGLDKVFPLNTTAGKTATFSVAALVKGRWQLVLQWKSGQKNYLYEEEVDLR